MKEDELDKEVEIIIQDYRHRLREGYPLRTSEVHLNNLMRLLQAQQDKISKQETKIKLLENIIETLGSEFGKSKIGQNIANVCKYLEKHGYLEKVNDRIYKVKEKQ